MSKQKYYLYILECRNNSYYIGYTTDINRRYQQHLDGSGRCKYTRSFPPQRLAACWLFAADLSSTLRMERKLKQLSREEKQQLVDKPQQLLQFVDRSLRKKIECL